MIEQIRLIGYGRDECKTKKKRVYTIPDFYMIHFIEKGSGFFNGIKLTAGQGFICMQNELCHYLPDKTDPWTYCWINVRGIGADKLISGLSLKNNIFSWNVYKNASTLKQIKEYKGNPTFEELAALSALYGIFAEQGLKQKMPRRDYVAEAKAMFEGALPQGITVDEVAASLNISRGYLRNIFYKSEGVSPQSYLMALRMNRAAELLLGDYSVTEIAAAVGYNDVLQFSKMFSRHFGISPTKYKAK